MKQYSLNNYCNIPISLLKIWTDNPRIGNALDEKNAINLLIETVGVKSMLNLAKDIVENGLAETEIPSVVQEANQFFVYDGNRRISCLKIIINPSIIDDPEIKQQFQSIFQDTRESILSQHRTIRVFNTTKDRALQLMDLAHNGAQDGVGRVPWESYQRDLALHRRGLTPRYKAAFYISKLLFKTLSKKNFIGAPSYTDLDRIFNAAVIKECIGITSDFSKLTQIEINKIKYAFEILKEARTDLKIHAYSRFFNTLTPENENVKKFIKYYHEIVSATPDDPNSCHDEQPLTTPTKNNSTKPPSSPISEASHIKPHHNLSSESKPENSKPNENDENDSPPKTRRTSRNTLITDTFWESKFSTLPDKYAPIRALIFHLKRIPFDEDKIPDNTLILTLLLRALLDQSGKAYREIKGLDTKDDLVGAIRSNIENLRKTGIMPKEIEKGINTNHISKLQSYIHHCGAKLNRNELLSAFDSLQSYIEHCLDEINKDSQALK